MTLALLINSSLTIPARDLSWDAVRSSGAGGQNVNKVSSKVTLRFDLAGTTALDEPVKMRLRALPGVRLDAEGKVLVVSQATRDQGRNLDDARDKLAALVAQALHRPRTRRPTRPGRGAVARRLDEKRQRSERKRDRSVVD